jgi:hypothetical protein
MLQTNNHISEQTALNHFACAINQKDGFLLSLNELLQAVTATNEIKAKLKFPNIHIKYLFAILAAIILTA